MLKSAIRFISFFSESALHSSPLGKRLFMQSSEFKVKSVKRAKLKAERQISNESVPIHCAFVARALEAARNVKSSKKKSKMKRYSNLIQIDTDEASSSSSNTVCSNSFKDETNVHGSMSQRVVDLTQDNSDDEDQTNVPKNFRKWEKVRQTMTTPRDGIPIRVLSYNVLAQCLLESHPYLYRSCSPNFLRWEYRSAVLFEEITNLNPDVICLQEVQESHLDSFFIKFENLGYKGVYKKRTGIRKDGCAIYFKSSLFKLLDHSNVEFFQPDFSLLNRDNIGLMVKLIPRCSANTPFVVSTTHLLYNPRRADVRLAQMQVLLAEIDRFSYCEDTSIENRVMHLPTIMTGDLNSQPESVLYSLIVKGQVGWLNQDSNDFKKIAVTDKCQHLGVYINRKSGEHSTHRNLSKLHNSEVTLSEAILRTVDAKYERLFNSGNIEHNLAFSSVYPDDGKDVKLATTFQDNWTTVDYIFYSTKNTRGELALTERLKLPTAGECYSVNLRLPNHVYGSDHLALAAQFTLKPNE